jgi:diguanylate cyclase (GGDEF)-like protein
VDHQPKPCVEELIALARRNEEIASKLFDIEVQIMNISRSRDFFEKLLHLVQESFAIEYVWVTLTESAVANQLTGMVGALDVPLQEAHICNTVDFLRVTQSSKEPILVNEQIGRFRLLAPGGLWKDIASLAILPLFVSGQLIGSLNFGSKDLSRYDPGKDRFFLKQLAVKTSICLASVVAHERISFLATRDPLTLLKNRREMEESLEQEISRARRHRYPLSLLFIDCDDFKQVNDTYGHDCGDVYLKFVADVLNDTVRKGDSAFRFAGDEFVVVLPNQNRFGAEKIAERIREQLVQSPLIYQDAVVPVHISYGAASSEELTDLNSRLLLKAADTRLYAMKEQKPSKKKTFESQPS